MTQLGFTAYDFDCMLAWRISASEDSRTPAEVEMRFVVPQWLRRTMWRHFWAEQDERMP